MKKYVCINNGPVAGEGDQGSKPELIVGKEYEGRDDYTRIYVGDIAYFPKRFMEAEKYYQLHPQEQQSSYSIF